MQGHSAQINLRSPIHAGWLAIFYPEESSRENQKPGRDSMFFHEINKNTVNKSLATLSDAYAPVFTLSTVKQFR